MNLTLILKGFLIGVGKIIPGVSGSLIAITLGVYDKMLGCVSNFFKNIKENIKFLMPIGIGILLSIVLTSKLLSFLLTNYYIIVMLFFIGLIIGGIPTPKTKSKVNKNILFTIITFTLIIVLCFIKTGSDNEIHHYSILTLFLIGMLDAATMIIPGISGTAIMMVLGCYNTVLNIFSNIYLLDNMKQAIPFFLGVGFGIIILSKIISFCFKKYNEQTYYCILGFMLSSILLLITNVFKANGNIFEYLTGFILFIIGCKAGKILEKKEDKNH